MTYLYVYMAIGVVVFLVVFISHRLSTKSESNFTAEMMEAVYPERKTWQYKLLNSVVVPTLAAVLMLVAWPAVIFMKGKDLLFQNRAEPESEPEKRDFSVERGDLLVKMTVEEIEQRERVTDPMGAVPDLPFGHLNAAWSKFIVGLGSEEAVWTFSASWTSDWGRKEIRGGYVIVREASIGPHFLTIWRMVDDDLPITDK